MEVLSAPSVTVRAAVGLEEAFELMCDLYHVRRLLPLGVAVRFTIPHDAAFNLGDTQEPAWVKIHELQ